MKDFLLIFLSRNSSIVKTILHLFLFIYQTWQYNNQIDNGKSSIFLQETVG